VTVNSKENALEMSPVISCIKTCLANSAPTSVADYKICQILSVAISDHEFSQIFLED